MRDISRKRKRPTPPKPKIKKQIPKPVPKKPIRDIPPPPTEPSPCPIITVVGYVEKIDVGEWTANIGAENQPIVYDDIPEVVGRMKDAVAWINEVCEEKSYELKEVVKV